MGLFPERLLLFMVMMVMMVMEMVMMEMVMMVMMMTMVVVVVVCGGDGGDDDDDDGGDGGDADCGDDDDGDDGGDDGDDGGLCVVYGTTQIQHSWISDLTTSSPGGLVSNTTPPCPPAGLNPRSTALSPTHLPAWIPDPLP